MIFDPQGSMLFVASDPAALGAGEMLAEKVFQLGLIAI